MNTVNETPEAPLEGHAKPLVKTVGFDHLVLKCRDVERSLAFYVGTLGLQAMHVDEWRSGHLFFPSVRISSSTIIDLIDEAPTGSNIDHICLVIEPTDLDALAASFPAARRADQVLGAQGHGCSLYVFDPDGNTVELRVYGH